MFTSRLETIFVGDVANGILFTVLFIFIAEGALHTYSSMVAANILNDALFVSASAIAGLQTRFIK